MTDYEILTAKWPLKQFSATIIFIKVSFFNFCQLCSNFWFDWDIISAHKDFWGLRIAHCDRDWKSHEVIPEDLEHICQITFQGGEGGD